MKYRFRKAETKVLKKVVKRPANEGFSPFNKRIGNILCMTDIGIQKFLWQTDFNI